MNNICLPSSIKIVHMADEWCHESNCNHMNFQLQIRFWERRHLSNSHWIYGTSLRTPNWRNKKLLTAIMNWYKKCTDLWQKMDAKTAINSHSSFQKHYITLGCAIDVKHRLLGELSQYMVKVYLPTKYSPLNNVFPMWMPVHIRFSVVC